MKRDSHDPPRTEVGTAGLREGQPACDEGGARVLEGDAPGFFFSESWFALVAETASPSIARPVVVRAGNAALYLQHHESRIFGIRLPVLASRTCLYSTVYGASDRAGRGPAAVEPDLAHAVAESAPSGIVWLDCLEEGTASYDQLLATFRDLGWTIRAYRHFANWYDDLSGGFDSFFSARPSRLQHAITRKSRKLERERSWHWDLYDSSANAERVIQAYEEVHAESWKATEPHPRFLAELIRRGLRQGKLVAGVLAFDGRPAAVQVWVVDGGHATIFKLVHRQSEQAYSPGTLLTWLMMRRLCEEGRIDRVDFGRGNEPFKALWLGRCRYRYGLIACNPRTPAGLTAAARHIMPGGIRRLLGGRAQ